MPSNFDLYPQPTSGQGPFGKVPGAIGLPQPAQDLAAQYPNLSKTNSTVSSSILSKLNGAISPQTMKALQDASARFGVASGMPGSGLALHNLFGNIAGFSENQQQQGLQDYNATIPTISRTQTVSPELQTEIASHNALTLSSPDPTQSQTYAQQLFDKYLGRMGGGGGGGGRTATSGLSPLKPLPSGTPPAISLNSTGTGSYYNGVYRASPPGSASVPYYDATVGGYVDPTTGSVADSPGGTPWSGFSLEGINTPAEPASEPITGGGAAPSGNPNAEPDFASMSDDDLMSYITGIQ